MNATANWWEFSIEPKERAAKIADNPDKGTREINPTIAGGRRLIDYGDYLGLDDLLAAQIPASQNPDERAFITTHHFFEIAFKQMIFDLAIVARTFERVSEEPDTRFFELCAGAAQTEEFWRPAVFAANRINYYAAVLLPAFFAILDKSPGKAETFSGAEYALFRPYLPPASGFQSAQFRLLQRAFGKSGLFQIRLFPAQEYSRDYTGADSPELIEITDKIVLRDEITIANPPENSPLHLAASVETFANRIFARLAAFISAETNISPVAPIDDAAIENATDAFRRILAIHRKDQEKIGEKPDGANEFDRLAAANFEQDLRRVANAENRRRSELQTARAGAQHLRRTSDGFLIEILNNLVETDKQLFGAQETSFLSLHLRMAADRIREVQEIARAAGAPEQPAGTGGGGVPYLINARNHLIGFFPFLIAFRQSQIFADAL